MKHNSSFNTNECVIRYTTIDGKIIDVEQDVFEAVIISHTYTDEGVIVFDKPITKLPPFAFRYGQTLESVTIPDCVKTFSVYSFEWCHNLKELNHCFSDKKSIIIKGVLKLCVAKNLTEYTIPSGVTKVGNGAFRHHEHLKKVTIPQGVQVIGACAFQFCHMLSEVIICDGVSEIGQSAFSNCTNLERITIPNSVINVGDWAFVGCRSLIEFNSELALADKRCLVLNGKLVAFASAGVSDYTFPPEITSYKETIFDYNNKIKGLKKVLKKTVEQNRGLKKVAEQETQNTPLKAVCDNNNSQYNSSTDIVAITNNGYIKRTAKREFKTQTIGSGGVLKNYYTCGVRSVKEASLADTLLLFTEKGRCCRIDVVDIPDTNKSEAGLSLHERFSLYDDNFCEILSVKSLFTSDEIGEYEVFIMTRQGRVVRHRLIDYKDKRQCSKVITIDDNDMLASAILTKHDDCLFNCSTLGWGKIFSKEDVAFFSPTSKALGVSCGKPSLVSLDISKDCNTSYLLVTRQGYLSRVESAGRMIGRGCRGFRLLNLRDSDVVVYNSFAMDDESVLIVTAKGYALKLNIGNLKTCKQGVKGTLCIGMSEGDNIVACCRVSPSKEIKINKEKFIAYKQETEEAQSLLSNIFTEVEETEVEYANSADSVIEMLKVLFEKDIWNKEELEKICKSKGLILGAILEEINDYSYSKVDDAVVDDNGDTIYVTLGYKEDLL